MHNQKVNAKCIYNFLIKTLVAVYTSKGTLLNYYSDGTTSNLHLQYYTETKILIRTDTIRCILYTRFLQSWGHLTPILSEEVRPLREILALVPQVTDGEAAEHTLCSVSKICLSTNPKTGSLCTTLLCTVQSLLVHLLVINVKS